MDQVRLRTVIMRGGTSRAIFFMRNELPAAPELRDRVVLRVFGSPDRRQIDGLAGADPLTSKLAIIGPSSRSDADVDYLFGQVSIDACLVDYRSNCGNISSAVGPYAIDEGLVPPTEPVAVVRIHNINTSKILTAEVPVRDGKAVTQGDFVIPGVPGSGAEVVLDFSDTAGANTGRVLPTGAPTDFINLSKRGAVQVSIVDTGNVSVFIRAADLGLEGTELPDDVDGDPGMLTELEELRGKAAELIGMVSDWRHSTVKSPATPFVAFVSTRHEYRDRDGKTVTADQIDFVSRMMFMQTMHKAYAGTGTVATGVAARIPGTIVNQVVREGGGGENLNGPLTIGHPSGTIVTDVEVHPETLEIRRATLSRTARRLMEGYAFIPSDLWSSHTG